MPKKRSDSSIRVVSVSDFHCGNIAGLTPPKFNLQSDVSYKAYVYRRGLYEWFMGEIGKLGPIDICVANGDLIDGKGDKTGGNEQIVTDRNMQVAMAVQALKDIGAKEYHFTYGTGYHTGRDDDWEVKIATEFTEPVHDVLTLNVRGLSMKWRHHIGGSLAPSGRANALLRQQEWDTLWSANGEFERSDVMVFGHVHYFQAYTNRFGSVFTSPALQGLGGSQLGSRRMGGIVDYGFLHFDITSREDWSWRVHQLVQTPKVRSGIVAA